MLALVIGIVWTIWRGAAAWRRYRQPASGYRALEQAFGSALLLSVEIFVADLVRAVVIAPTLDNVLVLGLFMLIRTKPSSMIASLRRISWKLTTWPCGLRSPPDIHCIAGQAIAQT